jgi:hypothetical protein
MPVSVDVCVGTPVALTETVAFRVTPAPTAVVGRNCTNTVQALPGVSVVVCGGVPGPQVVPAATIMNSPGLAPASTPFPTPVNVTLPVLVNVNVCVGPVVEPRATVP